MLYIKYLRVCFTGLIVLLFTLQSTAQSKVNISRDIPINLNTIVSTLSEAPIEFSQEAQTKPLNIALPLPSGGERLFTVVESPIMAADFAALYPNFKTYGLVAVDNPHVTGRMTVTPYGLNAIVFLEAGTMGIRARDLLNPRIHQVYLGEGDNPLLADKCQFDESLTPQTKPTQPPTAITAFSNGTTRRTYRFAVVTTGEFTAANGGTVSSASAVVTASVNAIQAIYDRELSVRFTLLTPFIFTDYTIDDFNPSSGLSRTAMAAQSVIAHFAVGTFDIGHVLHDQDQTPALHSGGGVAGLGVVCSNTTGSVGGTGPNKAAGWSGSFDNASNGWYGLFAHEVGHMFGMPHTFNGSGASNCTTGNISSTTAYEIGSGNSLMSYNGLCDATQNITDGGTADDYFHTNSLELAVSYMAANTCQTSVSTGNTAPVVNANPCGGSYTIPLNTPFTLTGSGTDANGDVIYYSWEQYDEDGAGIPTQGFIGATAGASSIAPLFRSYPPTTSPSRTFPAIGFVVSNTYSSSFEPLPTVARTLNFRLTGRDYNTNGGGIHSTDLAVTVSGAAFSVSAPNGSETLSAGGTTTVTWNVGGTAGYCTSVNIKMSIDGGFNYPYVLVSGTPNDGTQSVTLPAGVVNTSTARIRVECANSCVSFFDISNNNFSITSTCAAASSNICPTTDATFIAGNSGLALTLSKSFGGTITSNTSTITATEPNINIAAYNPTSTACELCGFNNKYKTLPITVSATGAYTFSISGSASFSGITIYTAASFNASSSCLGFVGSNYRHNLSGNTTIFSSVTVSLTECTSYVIVLTDLNAATPFTTTINVSSSIGTMYADNAAPSASYAYTYVAVNTTDSKIKAVSSTANFTSLTSGIYNIYGASYKTDVTTSAWVTQTMSQILSSADCALFSTNFKKVTVNTALSVDLLKLEATPLSNTVRISWQTANEIQNKGFQVERLNASGDGWAILGFIAANGKASNYEFIDNAPLSNNYYRLRQLDNDGKEMLSKTVSVAFKTTNKLTVNPNPVSQFLTVETTEKSDYHVFNLLGQTVLTGKTTQQIDVSILPKGTYILKIGIEQAKFVKQ
jgi:hypothetical protein